MAIESLEELVEKVKEFKQVEELKPLTASTAHHRAISRLREHFAKKRGGGQTESLEARRDAGTTDCDPAGGNSPLDELGQTELAVLLREIQTDLKPEQRAIISDFFLHGFLLPVLQETWKGSEIKKFASASDLENWEHSWPSGGKEATVKVTYDPTSGEVRVSGRRRGLSFQKTFPVGEDASSAIHQARAFVLLL